MVLISKGYNMDFEQELINLVNGLFRLVDDFVSIVLNMEFKEFKYVVLVDYATKIYHPCLSLWPTEST